jgi:3-dehydroquinate dehydratase-2
VKKRSGGAQGLKILVIHGPNLNLLGAREPGVYGKETLAGIDRMLEQRAAALGVVLETFQSNSESRIVDRIQEARGAVEGILINPAALTHTSVAIRDALLATGIPFVEVHISNIHAREEFRKRSFFSDIALGVVSGFGAYGYVLGLEGLVRKVQSRQAQARRPGR